MDRKSRILTGSRSVISGLGVSGRYALDRVSGVTKISGHVFVIVFGFFLHVDIQSFLFIILNSLGVLLIISSLFVVSLSNKKDVTSILVVIVLGICV